MAHRILLDLHLLRISWTSIGIRLRSTPHCNRLGHLVVENRFHDWSPRDGPTPRMRPRRWTPTAQVRRSMMYLICSPCMPFSCIWNGSLIYTMVPAISRAHSLYIQTSSPIYLPLQCRTRPRKSVLMQLSTQVVFRARLLLSQEESVVSGELMWKLCMPLGKMVSQHRSSKRSPLTEGRSRVHVCVGDMNDEEGQKMESQLPG